MSVGVRWKQDQPGQEAKRLIFIDETWAKTNNWRQIFLIN